MRKPFGSFSPRRQSMVALAVGSTVALLGGFVASSATPPPAGAPALAPTDQPAAQPACAQPRAAEHASCAVVLAAPQAAPQAGDVEPLTAADLQDAYNLPSDLLGSRQTVAVVTAFDYPTAAEDLAVYRDEHDLPPCDSDFPCLRKVDQRGGNELPAPDPGWSLAAATGLQMVSAACPNCRLLLVEADDNTFADLALAVDQAVDQGADVVGALYGGPEYAEQLADAGHYHHPGVPITAPSGNGAFPSSGGVQQVPASYSSVIAVGGTTLYRDETPRGWSEEAWSFTGTPSGSGSGCSTYVPKPPWQSDPLCGSKRTVADLAAVADTATPVAIYDSYGQPGWIAVGGTQVAAAVVAGVYALAGNADTVDPGRHLYAHERQLFDVTSGSTGYCGGSYLCTAGPGYDGPTGLGTPNGVGAF